MVSGHATCRRGSLGSMQRFGACGVVVLMVLAAAAHAEPRSSVFSTREGAIRGYDPVAYFEQGTAVKGKKKHSWTWQSARWSFASEANLGRFRADPDRYAPQYGGYCAYAMSKGSYASTDPHAWTIHNGKLYLNFSKQVRAAWGVDIDENITRADEYWKRLAPGRR